MAGVGSASGFVHMVIGCTPPVTPADQCADAPMLTKMANIGMIPGRPFDSDKFNVRFPFVVTLSMMATVKVLGQFDRFFSTKAKLPYLTDCLFKVQ